jgi:hypothetical protein
MAKRAQLKPKTIRARRRSVHSKPQPSTGNSPTQELSNYELLERRSRELEMERSRGGSGASQPPDAPTPLLYPGDSRPAGAPSNESAHVERARDATGAKASKR